MVVKIVLTWGHFASPGNDQYVIGEQLELIAPYSDLDVCFAS